MKDALEKLYREHRQGLYSYALSLTGSNQMAEDAIQNGFLGLVKNQRAWNGNCENQVAYLFKSVRNAATDLGRTVQRQNALSQTLFETFGESGQSGEPMEHALTKERDAILRQAIDQLDEKDQEAVVLKLFGGLTFEQAGEVANASPKTIATRYRRALKKLENQLKGIL